MALKYDKPKGLRIKSRFLGATSTDNVMLWFNTTLNKWENRDETEYNHNYGYSSHAPCLSVRAFRRMLKKLPKTYKLRLVSRYVGFDVHGCGGKSLS